MGFASRYSSSKLPISVTFDDHFSPDILQGVARRAMLSIIEPELFEGCG